MKRVISDRPVKTDVARIRITQDLKQAAEKAAKADGITMSEWIRRLIDVAANDNGQAVA